MENIEIQKKKDDLLNSLTPTQRDFFPAFDWFYNGPRGSGRTYLSCVAALIGLLNGQHQVFVWEHYNVHEGSLAYTKNMIHSLAYKIEFAIEIKDVRGGFIVRRAPDYVQYEIDYRKSK